MLNCDYEDDCFLSFKKGLEYLIVLQCQASELSKHFKAHSGENLINATNVTFASSRVINLRTHLKTQSGEKSYKCKQCDFTSYQAEDLRAHLKIHSGEKPNKCNQWDYACNQAGHLRTHVTDGCCGL